jgi:hypothetical protein
MARYLSETSVFLNFRAEIPRPRLGDLGIQLQRSERNRNCEALHAKIGTDLQRSVSLRILSVWASTPRYLSRSHTIFCVTINYSPQFSRHLPSIILMNPLHQPQRSKLSTMKRDYQSTKSSTSDSESDSHSDSDSESEILTPEVLCQVGLNVAEFVKKHYNKLPMRTSILSGAV